MTSSENDCSNKQATCNNAQEEANIYEDEINLIDYFIVLWKHKWLISFGSVLPALVVGLAVFLGPEDYKISYTYNMGPGEKDFRVLEDKFYSTENSEKLIEKLQASDIKEHTKKITCAGTAEDLMGIVSFEVFPSYFDTIEPSKTANLDELEGIQRARGTLLTMHIQVQSKEYLREIASIYRNNFEQVIPLYSVREELNSKIIGIREEMASIEEARYTLNLQLESGQSVLEKLKKSGSESMDKVPSNIVLQFNIEPSKTKEQDELQEFQNSAFLPLACQVQATKTQIINLEEQIVANKDDYDYYADLLKLNRKLFSHAEKLMTSYYTLGQFNAFLTNALAEYKKDEPQLQDYLKAYIKRTENKIASAMPLVEKPKVYSIAKGIAQKSAIVFVIAMMMSVFVSFLLEGLKKSKARAS